nr:hypothetical protein [uncultured Muribaculum sp.]
MSYLRKLIDITASTLLMLAAVSCSDNEYITEVDDPSVQPGDRAATIEVPLRFHVEKPSLIGKPLVNDIPSRAEGDEETDDPKKAAEEAINDIWVLQGGVVGDQEAEHSPRRGQRQSRVCAGQHRRRNVGAGQGLFYS